jgi:hypothetical protein
MIAIAHARHDSQPAAWHAGFLSILPRIERSARIAFRTLRADVRDDAVCEVIANCLSAYHRLYERSQLHRAFASPLVRYAVAQYHAGRRVGTSQCGRDLYGLRASKDGQFQFRSIGTPVEQRQEWMECLTDNRRTPVPEQAHFRIEFPRWLRTQTRRNRQIAERLSLGYSTAEVAQRFKVSPGRISQIRRELHDSWQAFTADRQPSNSNCANMACG